LASAGYSLWLELEPHCNLSCRFCYNPWRPAHASAVPKGVPVRLLLPALDRLVRRFALTYAALSGGEPLLYRGLPEVVAFLHARGVPTVLTTNGRLATRGRLGELAACGLRGLQVPLLAGVPAIHDYLAGGPSWHAAVTALALGLELGVSTTAVCVLSRPNAGQIREIVRVCKLLGVDRLILNRVHIVGQAKLHQQELYLDEATFVGCVEQAHADSGGEFEVTVGSTSCSEVVGKGPRRLTVSPSGELKLCNESCAGVLSIVDCSDGELDGLASRLEVACEDVWRASVDTCSCLGVGV
jgi:cyclic pyranopterin phosphate synthase